MVKDESSHEGLIFDDGPHRFQIIKGRRAWLTDPPPNIRAELLIEADRLRLSQSIRQSRPSIP